MDIIKIGTELLAKQMGGEADSGNIASALSSLLGDGQGNIDLAGLASKMTANGDLGGILSSWLGDGANSAISPKSIIDMLGQGNVADFASKLGADPEAAAGGLADMLPQIMDQASSGGSLLDSLGGAGGLLGAVKSLLK